MKSDYEFVKTALEHKDNKMIHYPALRQLIKNFEDKWKVTEGNSIALTRYKYHLKSLLWYTFTNNRYTDQ